MFVFVCICVFDVRRGVGRCGRVQGVFRLEDGVGVMLEVEGMMGELMVMIEMLGVMEMS